jgi:hypothetical protein
MRLRLAMLTVAVLGSLKPESTGTFTVVKEGSTPVA